MVGGLNGRRRLNARGINSRRGLNGGGGLIVEGGLKVGELKWSRGLKGVKLDIKIVVAK